MAWLFSFKDFCFLSLRKSDFPLKEAADPAGAAHAPAAMQCLTVLTQGNSKLRGVSAPCFLGRFPLTVEIISTDLQHWHCPPLCPQEQTLPHHSVFELKQQQQQQNDSSRWNITDYYFWHILMLFFIVSWFCETSLTHIYGSTAFFPFSPWMFQLTERRCESSP